MGNYPYACSSSPSSDKREVYPGHMVQVQTCDCTNVKVKDCSLKEGWCSLVCENPTSFHFSEHPSVTISNLLESHFSTWLWATIHILVQVHSQVVLSPCGSHGWTNWWAIGDCLFLRLYCPRIEKPYLPLGPSMMNRKVTAIWLITMVFNQGMIQT